MNEWDVVTVIIALVGLFVTVVKPLLTLNTTMATLTSEMQNTRKEMSGISKSLEDLSDTNTANHKRMWDKIDEHGDTLLNHAKRIDHLENVERGS